MSHRIWCPIFLDIFYIFLDRSKSKYTGLFDTVSLTLTACPERIQLKVAVLTFEVLICAALFESAGSYARHIYHLRGWRGLYSARIICLVVPPFKLSLLGTVGLPLLRPETVRQRT